MITAAELALARARIEAAPESMGWASMSIQGSKGFSKEEILQHIDARDSIGTQIAAIQMNYMRYLKARAGAYHASSG